MPRVTISTPWPVSAAATRQLLSLMFQVSLATYVSFSFLEYMFPGFVSFSFSLATLLWPTIFLGILTAAWPTVTNQSLAPSIPGVRTWLGIVALSAVAAWTVGSQVKALGALSMAVAIVAGVVVGGIAFLLSFERHDPPTEESTP